MKIGVVQINSGRDSAANIAALAGLLPKIADADLVLTPEATNLMGFDPKNDVLPVMADDPLVQFTCDYARQAGQMIVLGSVLVSDEETGRPVNRQIMIDADGAIIATYDKIHMFDVVLPNGEVYRESERFQAGREYRVTQHACGVGIGHSICFDLRFGAQFRALAERGAGIILAPAAFTKLTGEAHWEVLLRARAIENGAFVIAAGQTGSYRHYDGSMRATWGHSMVVDPWGTKRLALGEAPDAAMVEIDLDQIDRVRTQIPVLELAGANRR